MAAVLEMLLDGKVSVKNIISWLCHKECDNEEICTILNECSVVSEFLPFFINYLRDQTAHLIYHGASNAATPAKTPNSIQKLRRSSLSNSKPRSTSQRGNRTQLFSSNSFRSDVSDLTESSFQSLDDSPVPMWDQNESGSRNWKRSPFDRNLDSSTTKGKRVSPFGHKKEEQVTFGEFLNKSDGQHHRGRRNKSPAIGHNQKEEYNVTPSNTRRKSGGKSRSGHSDGSSQKSRYKQRPQMNESPPVFNLDEFPTVGSTQAPTRSTPRSTPRRITPTAVISTDAQLGPSYQSPLFSSSDGRLQSGQTHSSPSYSPNYNNSMGNVNGMCTLPSPVQSTSRITFTSSTQSSRNQTASSSSASISRGLDKERELLRLERLKQGDYVPSVAGSPRDRDPSTPPKHHRTPSKTPTKSPAARSGLSTVMEAMLPSKDGVTFNRKLDALAELYSACLQECLVSNLTVELYFLMQLLTAKGTLDNEESELNKDRDTEDINYLCSIHNCVYFAVTVLHKQLGLLSMLDQSTLRLLSDNIGICEFSPVLNSELEVLCDSCGPIHAFSSSLPIQVVPFLADTDNRKNFPTDRSFHSFKKQRDKFYELVREWQAFHSKPGWRMKEAMSKRVKELVQQTGEIANYTHFVRLFRSQLIRMCEGDLSVAVADGDDTADFGFLSQLKKTNPEKFKRLEERFSMPTSAGGPCPLPSFPGCQEFFKEFIVAAENYTFNQHLIDSFSSQILELNEMQFPLPEQDSDQPSPVIEEEQQESFNSCLHTLRVLAKFLGFVIFLPYQAGNQLPEGILEDVIAVRNKTAVPLDLLIILKNCGRDARFILTIPWIVEYLSMMDHVAPQLQHYQTVLKLLVQVYGMLSARLASRLAPYNVILLLMLLGWLLEIPCIPASLYFTAFSDDFEPIDARYPEIDDRHGIALDHIAWIDQQILYKCCPFLVDIRILLAQTALGVASRSTPIRKITPVAADSTIKSIISTQQLQLELENNFFHNHSPSLKKTVEFISNRIASNCIKSIDATLVSDARKAVIVMVTQLVQDGDVSSTNAKNALLQKARNKCVEMSSSVKEEAHQVGAKYVVSRCKAGLEVLLLEDVSGQIQDTATGIAVRLGMDRVTRWINTQTSAALQKELASHFDKIVRSSQQAKKEASVTDKMTVRLPDVHIEESPFPSDVIQILKDLLRYLLVEPLSNRVTAEHINSALFSVRTLLHSRQDLTPVGLQSVHSLSVDLAAALTVSKPDILDRIFPCEADPNHAPIHHVKNEQETTSSQLAQEIDNMRLADDATQKYITNNHSNLGTNTPVYHGNNTHRNLENNFPVHHGNRTPSNTSRLHISDNTISVNLEDKSYAGNNIQDSLPSKEQRCSRSVRDSFIHLWKTETLGKVAVDAFLCPKNIVLMDNNQNMQMCWYSIETIVKALSDNALTSTREIYTCLQQLLNSPYIYVSPVTALTMINLATHVCDTDVLCKKDSSDDVSDMDRLLQKVADRCSEPAVLEAIYNYYTAQHIQQTV